MEHERGDMITIIIPTRNRERQLAQCMDALADQTASGDFVVIIGDDHSDYDVAEQVEAHRLSKLVNCRTVKDKGRGAAVARNEAAKHATGNILAFLDDDAIPNENWVSEIYQAFDIQGTYCITGRVLPLQSGLFSKSRQARYDARRCKAMSEENQEARFLAGGNAAISRKLFEELRGFDPDFVMMHDFELLIRVRAQGYICRYVDEMVVHHQHVKRRSDAFLNSFRAGAYRFLLTKKHDGYRTTIFAEIGDIFCDVFKKNIEAGLAIKTFNLILNCIHLTGFIFAKIGVNKG